MLNPKTALSSRSSFLFLLLVLFATGPAFATTFDFTGSARTNDLDLDTGGLGHRITLREGDLTLRVRAFDEHGDRGEIHRNRDGLGVSSNPAGGAVGSPESLRFSFSGPAVSVSGLIFERGADNGRLELYVDGRYAQTIRWATGGGTVAAHDFGDVTGSVFELRGDRRSFRVSSVTAVPSVVSAIPEPSAAFLFGAGALVVSNATRRRSA
ncbi:MAG: PEP-CTERM sorting domain-containing protein [Myxococcota bacterium]